MLHLIPFWRDGPVLRKGHHTAQAAQVHRVDRAGRDDHQGTIILWIGCPRAGALAAGIDIHNAAIGQGSIDVVDAPEN